MPKVAWSELEKKLNQISSDTGKAKLVSILASNGADLPLEKVIEVFVEAGDPWNKRAAYMAMQAGQHEEAAKIYEKMGNFKGAAKAYLRAGLPEKAVENYERTGKLIVAGDLALENGLEERARELYSKALVMAEKDENLIPAAVASSKLGMQDKANALYQKQIRILLEVTENTEYLDYGYDRTIENNIQAIKIAKRAGLDELMTQTGQKLFDNLKKAYRLSCIREEGSDYSREGLIHAAADIAKTFEPGTDIRAKLLGFAIRNYEKEGDKREGKEHWYFYRPEFLYKQAADLAASQRQFRRAARLYEKAGLTERQANVSMHAGFTRKARKLYEEAAQEFEAQGRFRQAAKAARLAGIDGKAEFYRNLFNLKFI